MPQPTGDYVTFNLNKYFTCINNINSLAWFVRVLTLVDDVGFLQISMDWNL